MFQITRYAADTCKPQGSVYQTSDALLALRVHRRLCASRTRAGEPALFAVEPYPEICLFCGVVPGHDPRCQHC